MTTFGQLCLLTAFVASGYAALACFLGWRSERPRLVKIGIVSGIVGTLTLTLAVGILAVALVRKDFRFAYVAQYCDRSLAWYYALSAFWVGQAGSLLFWAWSVAVLAIVFRFRRAQVPRLNVALTDGAFAILMAYQCFLVAIMVFGADPMQPGLSVVRDGAGLSPTLQHPAMLLHPPVVFLGYAACAIPFALAFAAMLTGRLDSAWLRAARGWAFFAWIVLGFGILIGAYWAYEELGWGGYWNWDPVENGSLIPWLAITAMIHAAMAYRQRGSLKRTTLALAVATFAACNFAAFLTRSGIFSSLHAFSQSPIGWMFLILFIALAFGTAYLMLLRRAATTADSPVSCLSSREGVITASVFVLILLTLAVFFGTASLPVTELIFPHKVLVGAGFFNGVLIPTGLLLLVAMALSPFLRWGAPPDARQRNAIYVALVCGAIFAGLAWLGGLRHPLAVAVAAFAGTTLAGFVIDIAMSAFATLFARRRTLAGYTMHIAVACLAVGVAGSSLGTRQHEATLHKGEAIHWANRTIRLVEIQQETLPEKLLVRAQLEVTADGATPFTVSPTQALYFLQKDWHSEVAIHATWSGDFYAILHGGERQDQVLVTLVENPLMRWMWAAGCIVPLGAVFWFWPTRKRKGTAAGLPSSASERRRPAA